MKICNPQTRDFIRDISSSIVQCVSEIFENQKFLPPFEYTLLLPAPRKIVLYNAQISILSCIKKRVIHDLNFRDSSIAEITFSLRQGDILNYFPRQIGENSEKIKEGSYYVNVGYFFSHMTKNGILKF